MKHLIISIYDSGYGFGITIIDNNKVVDSYPNGTLNIASCLKRIYDTESTEDFEKRVKNKYGNEFDTICCIENASTEILKG